MPDEENQTEPVILPEPTETPKPTKKAKPQRVSLSHPRMKGEAKPLAKDKRKWLEAGWLEKSSVPHVKKSAGNAD